MADTKLRREDKLDEQANEMFASHPDLQEQEQAAGKNTGIGAGIDQTESYANDPKNSSKNISDAQEGEDSAGSNGLYNQNTTKQRFSAKGLLKKGGPTGGIFGLIFGGIFGMGVLLSPSLAIVHLKEVLTDDLNDTVAAMDIRSVHVFKAKLKDLGKRGPSSCTFVKVRCGLRGMSDKQIKNFEKAGITVEKVGDKNSFGKTQVKSLTFTTSAGKDIKVENPSQLSRYMGDKNIRNQLRRAYNPKFYSVSDKLALKTFREKLKTDNSKKIKSNDPKKIASEIDEATAGDKVQINTEKKPNNSDETEEKKQENDTKASADADEFKKGIDDVVDTDSTFKNMSSNLASGAMKGVMITGTLDTACSVYGGIGAVSALAKTKRALQLAQYTMVFFNFADSIKAGDATPEQASYFGNTLTSVDSRKEIQNESSKASSSGISMVKNPDYNKSAFDAQAIKAGFYNDAPTLNSRSQNFLVGGGLVGTLDGVRNKVARIIGGSTPKDVKDNCSVVQNIFVRIGAAAVGIGAGALSFGASTIASFAASVAISMAMPLIQSYLGKIAAGKVVSSATKGVDAGNAIFSGAGVLLGSSAKARGMKPATKGDLKSYLTLKNDINNEYIAMETEDDSKDPLNVNKRYSFIGSFARNLFPTTMQGGSLFSFTNTLNILRVSTSFLTPTSYAVGTYNPERFSKCSDTGYQALGIDADIMCNVRYTLNQKELGMDTDSVIREMVELQYINGETGEANGEYKDWLENCTERTDGWGETSDSEGSGSDGSECLGNDRKSNLFRVYTMDNSITDGMDNGPDTGKGDDTSNPTLSFRLATFNILHSDGGNWRDRLKKSVATLTDNNIDVAGLQEARPNQQDLFMDPTYGGSIYDMYPSKSGRSGVEQNPDSVVIWNKSKFDLVSGSQKGIKYQGGDRKVNIVKLRSKNTNSEFYVLNTHDPIDNRSSSGNGPQDRYDNNILYYNTIKSELVDAPVVFTGDFNSKMTVQASANKPLNNKRENLAYCILTKENLLIHASDAQQGKQGCSSNTDLLKRNDVDHIFISPKLQASGYSILKRGSNGGDHDTVFIDVSSSSNNSNAGTSFRIASYNIENIKQGSGKTLNSEKGRFNTSIAKMKSSNFDIIGTQEMEGAEEFNYFKTNASDVYDFYPQNVTNGGKNGLHARTIMYKKDKFGFEKADEIQFPREGGTARAPVVWLIDKQTNQKIIVINTHNPAYGRLQAQRTQAAINYVAKVQQLSSENIPIFFTGDFNEGYGPGGLPFTGTNDYQNLSHCMFNSKKLLKSVEFNNPEAYCKPGGKTGGIDHILVSPSVQVTKFDELTSGIGTDHKRVPYADITVPGSNSSGSTAGSLAWPVNKKWWDRNKSDFLGPHIGTGTAWGGDNMGTSGKGAGIASDIGDPPVGEPVYAMLGGTVTSVNLCGSNDGIAIKSQVNGGTLGIAYMHGTTKKFKVGDTVKAGDHIMNVGVIGCNVFGAHVHIGMAYNGNYICPQDVFLAMANNQTPNFANLVSRGRAPCGRV